MEFGTAPLRQKELDQLTSILRRLRAEADDFSEP